MNRYKKYPVETLVYYVGSNSDRRFWMVKVSVGLNGLDEERYKFPCKPTHKQIQKKKREWVKEVVRNED